MGAGKGGSNPIWFVVWLLILLFIGLWVGLFCASWYIFIAPIAVCIPVLKVRLENCCSEKKY